MKMRALAAMAAAMISAAATPAWAGRTVIDAGFTRTIDGYCSPAATDTADCQAKALGFSITLGGQTFDSFVVHSNGVFALGGPIDFADKSAALASFAPPVFSPLLDNGSYYDMMPGSPSYGKDDGKFVADYAVSANSVKLTWYTCVTNIFCGARSLDAVFYDGGGLTRAQVELRQKANWSYMTLTKLDQGFSVTFDYSPRYDFGGGGAVPSSDPVHYGFDLPTASFEANGAAVSRTFYFDAAGARIDAPLPEPATWATMVAGFGLLGAGLRRRKATALA